MDHVHSTSTFHLVYTRICIGCVLAVNRTTLGIPVAIVLLTVDQKDLIGNRELKIWKVQLVLLPIYFNIDGMVLKVICYLKQESWVCGSLRRLAVGSDSIS